MLADDLDDGFRVAGGYDRFGDIRVRTLLASSKLNRDAHEVLEQLQAAHEAVVDYLNEHYGSDEVEVIVF